MINFNLNNMDWQILKVDKLVNNSDQICQILEIARMHI